MAEKIDSGFCFLDVKRGRVKLAKRVNTGEARIPVTIRGYITGISSQDDGTSIEFEVTVSDAVERLR
jgi:hypothetical protein